MSPSRMRTAMTLLPNHEPAALARADLDLECGGLRRFLLFSFQKKKKIPKRRRPPHSKSAAGSWSTPLHAFDEDAGRLRTHDALVGQFSLAQLLAQLPAADRYLLEAPRPVLIDQADPAQLLVEGREADLHRLDQQLALQLVELALGRQAVPDVRAVVIRCVGVLAANHEVGEAEVLPIDGVHDRLLRPGVEHLDVQPQKDDAIRDRAADLLPQLLVGVSLA